MNEEERLRNDLDHYYQTCAFPKPKPTKKKPLLCNGYKDNRRGDVGIPVLSEPSDMKSGAVRIGRHVLKCISRLMYARKSTGCFRRMELSGREPKI